MHAWFAGEAELERILSVWIRECLLGDLCPELNVSEAPGSPLYIQSPFLQAARPYGRCVSQT